MDHKHNVQIKVENEANADFDNEPYEEYVIMPHADCKEEEEKHIAHNDAPAGEEFEFVPTTTTPQNDEQTQMSNDSSQNNTRERAKKVNCHARKTIVNHFLTHGWTSKSYRDLCKKVAEEKVVEYGKTVSRGIREAQQFVYQECDSLCFGNISEWLEVFKQMNIPENSYYEPAIIVNAIVNNEKHPDPKEIGEVDLKAIYSFICNGLMGLPQQQLDPISAKFLAKEFESLIEEANSEVADSQTLLMKQKIERTLVEKINQVPPSLDPLWLTEGTIVHQDILSEENTKVKKTKEGNNNNNSQVIKKVRKSKKENKAAPVLCEDEKTAAITNNINTVIPKTEATVTQNILINPKNEPM